MERALSKMAKIFGPSVSNYRMKTSLIAGKSCQVLSTNYINKIYKSDNLKNRDNQQLRLNMKKFIESKQLVLAFDLYNKEYIECNRSEKNKINSLIHAIFSKYESIPYIIQDTNFELRNILKKFIKENILNKKEMLSKDKITFRYFQKNGNIRFYNYIYYSTYYLNNVKIQERIYHIMSDLYSVKQCDFCENKSNFLEYGRGYRRFCSIKCSKNEEELKQIGIIKELSHWTSEKKDYYKIVRRYTRRSLNKYNINPNNLPIGRNGSGEVYQVDHIIPIIEGYNKQIHPSIIGDIKNLQLLHWKDNNKKSDRNCL